MDNELGIIKSVAELPRQTFSPDYFYFKANVSNTSIFNGIDNIGITAGTSLNRNKALAKAIGEGIERYCACSYNYDQFIFSNYQDLVEKALHPKECQLYLKSQFLVKDFPLEEFTTKSKIHWVKARNCNTEESVYVPASLVFCPYEIDLERNEPIIVETISTGLAAHCSYNEAAINGFLEVIERNNFMCTWLSGESPLSLDILSLNDEHTKHIKVYEKLGYEVKLCYNPGVDGIPSFVALLRGKYAHNVPLLIAAATHLDPFQAVTKSLEELALMERFCQRKKLKPSSLASDAEFNKVHGLLDHIMLWFNPKIWPFADFLLNSKKSIALSEITNLFHNDPVKDLEYLVYKINKEGYKTIIADITTEDLYNLGLHVVRAIVPGYIPLNKSYLCRPIGARYLRSYYNGKNIDTEQILEFINPIPHPFA